MRSLNDVTQVNIPQELGVYDSDTLLITLVYNFSLFHPKEI